MPALPSLPLPRLIAGPRRGLRPRAFAGGLALALLMAGALPAPATAQEQQGLIADMQVRLTQLEQLVQQLTGQLEQAQFRNRELERRLDLLEREIDLGLSGDGGGGAMAAAPTTAASPPTGPAPSPQVGGPRPLAPDNGVLGYLGGDGGAPPGTAGGGGAGAGGASQQAALPAGPPEAQYQHAFSLLRQGSFEGAEAAFSAFIQAHPRHTLAGNAQYWLGETHYARGNYDAAARAFAKGFKDYPSGSKTPDNLFKLGMSMSALGKKREACAAFQKLRADYPGVAGTLSRQVADQMARNGC